MTLSASDRPAPKFPQAVFTRVVLFQLLLVLVSLAASALIARHFFRRQHLAQVEHQLADTLTLLSRRVPDPVPSAWCREQAQGTDLRFTVVARDGRVICDSHHDIATMDNHAGRPEIAAAWRSGSGESSRFSDTLGQGMFYGAKTLEGRELVLRASLPLSILTAALGVFDTSLTLFLLGLGVLLALAGIWGGRQLLFPLGRILVAAERTAGTLRERTAGGRSGSALPAGDDEPFAADESYGEWTELETSLETIRKDLATTAERLSVEREELATLMSAISDAILAVDTDGRALFFNTRFALSFGNEEALSKRTIAVWELFRAPEVVDAYQQALKQGRSATVNAIPFEGEAGGRTFFSLSVAPLRKTSLEIYGAVGVFHDVTELKRAEQIRIDFVANVSHELRTPLTSIKGYTDTLIGDMRAGRGVEQSFLDIIARNVERLMSLISDLLDLSSLESTDVLHTSPVDTAEITSRLVRQLEGGFKGKEQSVALVTDAPVVTADPRRLEQVLVNLLDNAGKYTPKGTKISVKWELAGGPERPELGEGPSDVILKISDNGPGISPEHQPRLFERFYRIDKARSREQGGTGLGLAIVKHIMQKHGGSVRVVSAPGAGTAFICRFPERARHSE